MTDIGADYDDNSSQAVLRVALAVAFSDDLLDHEEQAKVEQVYRNILSRMDEYDEDGEADSESEVIAQDVMDCLADTDSESERLEIYAEWAEAVTDPDLQEIALAAALQIAGEDATIDRDESETMSVFCDSWGLDLDDMLEPFLRDD
jgi:tellurite resistance protein